MAFSYPAPDPDFQREPAGVDPVVKVETVKVAGSVNLIDPVH